MNYKFNKSTGSFYLYDMETGKNWYNYIWNNNQFIVELDHFGGATAKLVSERGENIILNGYGDQKLTVPSYVFIRDDDSKDYFNPGFKPSCNRIDDYCCEHGLIFTTVSGRRNGLLASDTIAVYEDENAFLHKVTIKNESKVVKNLSVFGFAKFNLEGFVQPRYYYAENSGKTVYVDSANALLLKHNSPFMPSDTVSGFIMSSEKPDYFEGRYEHFIGTSGSITKPYILENGKNLTNSNGSVRTRCGILQNKITLNPGQEKTLYYIVGFASSKEEDLINRHNGLINKTSNIINTLYEKGLEKFGALTTNTPEERVNLIMNYWAQKQVSFCMIGKKAVRDNAQIALGMLNYNTELAKQAITECIYNQYYDGHALLTWSPFFREKEIYSDPSSWLILSICEYIKETGDFDYLNLEIPFLEGEKGTVLLHLKRACEWFMDPKNFGPNNLPLIHHADWNDALNIPDDTAESVFIAMLICLSFKELSELLQEIGDNDYAKTLINFKNDLAERINKKAYNGEYYVRAFSKFGVVGDKTGSNGGNIYVNPQTFAILSEIIPQDRLESVLNAMDSMENKYGVPLCAPAYKQYDESVGRMSAMPAGVYENGGIYNHACAFKVMADCKLGRSENAIATLLKMIPDGKDNPSSVTTTEPYVFTNCYLQNEEEHMVVGFAWQTGSSAWGLRDYYEGILGLFRTFNGLKVFPNIPKDWKEVTATRPYRGSKLNLTYINKGGKNVKLTVDGKEIPGDIIPAFTDKKEHNIIIECC